MVRGRVITMVTEVIAHEPVIQRNQTQSEVGVAGERMHACVVAVTERCRRGRAVVKGRATTKLAPKIALIGAIRTRGIEIRRVDVPNADSMVDAVGWPIVAHPAAVVEAAIVGGRDGVIGARVMHQHLGGILGLHKRQPSSRRATRRPIENQGLWKVSVNDVARDVLHVKRLVGGVSVDLEVSHGL